VAFGALAVWVNVRNRQRSEWFQTATGAALTATSLVPCVVVLGGIPRWGWLLWLLCALQATASIFVVHARLDARVASKRNDTRIAARKTEMPALANRRATFVSAAALWAAAAIFAYFGFVWIAAALLIAGAAYFWELRRQRGPGSLQMPLTRIGKQSLALSAVYGALVIAGLWGLGR
jgi:hypothetical protein